MQSPNMNNFKDEHQLFITGLQNSHGTSGDNSQSVIDSLQNQIDFLQKTNLQLTTQSTQLLNKLNQLQSNESTHIQELTQERSQCDSLNLQLDETTGNLNALEESLKKLKSKYNNEINLNLNLKSKLNNESIIQQRDNMDMHYSQLNALNDLKNDYNNILKSKLDSCLNNLNKYTNGETDTNNTETTETTDDINTFKQENQENTETTEPVENIENLPDLLHDFQNKNNNLTNLIIYSIKDKQDIDKLNYLYKLAQQKVLNWTTQEDFDSIKNLQFANFTNTTSSATSNYSNNNNNNIYMASSPTANGFRLPSPNGISYLIKKNNSNNNNNTTINTNTTNINNTNSNHNNTTNTNTHSHNRSHSINRSRPNSMILNNSINVNELPGIKRRVSKRQSSLINN